MTTKIVEKGRFIFTLTSEIMAHIIVYIIYLIRHYKVSKYIDKGFYPF